MVRHAPIATKMGIEPTVIEAIRNGRRPQDMTGDETIIYDFATELLHNRSVSDEKFDAAEKRFGKSGVIDLVGIVGYYTFNAMMLNVARYAAKDGTSLPRVAR
jgi:4-carboxymuconolactone decarboxylase